jgi:hypothetical protein
LLCDALDMFRECYFLLKVLRAFGDRSGFHFKGSQPSSMKTIVARSMKSA